MKIRIPLETYLKGGGELKEGTKLFTTKDDVVIVGKHTIYNNIVATIKDFNDFVDWFEIEVNYIPEQYVKQLEHVLDEFPDLDKPVIRDLVNKMHN